jgi:hypothetical protein
MATPTKEQNPKEREAATSGEKRTASYGTFIEEVSKATLLPRQVVSAWIIAEGGKLDNPLNIRRADGHFGGFGSQEAAARATIANLRNNPQWYSGILAAARGNDVRAMLQAIVDSPWDAGHYTAQRKGDKLFGVYRTAFGDPGKITGRDATDPSQTTQETTYSDPVSDAAGGILGGVTSWAQEKAVLALAYTVLSVGAVALTLLGLMQITGIGPGRAAAAVIPTRTKGEEDIPF